MNRPVLIALLIAAIGAIILVATFRTSCAPGDAGLTIGGVLKLAGC